MKKKVDEITMISMWSQSAPQSSIRWASEAKLAKSEDSIDGAIFAWTPIFFYFFGYFAVIKELKKIVHSFYRAQLRTQKGDRLQIGGFDYCFRCFTNHNSQLVAIPTFSEVK